MAIECPTQVFEQSEHHFGGCNACLNMSIQHRFKSALDEGQSFGARLNLVWQRDILLTAANVGSSQNGRSQEERDKRCADRATLEQFPFGGMERAGAALVDLKKMNLGLLTHNSLVASLREVSVILEACT